MRIVFIGAGEITLLTAERLIEKGHDVIIIEENKEKIEELSEQMDCSFLQGDGSKPHILREVSPKSSDVLFCLSDSDQDNLIASLVGRSLGFKRVITKIQDPGYDTICRELGLEHTIIPSRTISRYLADMVIGADILELSTVIKGGARFFMFTVQDEDQGRISELDLPSQARAICYYREDDFHLADEDSQLKSGDEVVILTDSETVSKLKERWEPEQANSDQSEKERDDG